LSSDIVIEIGGVPVRLRTDDPFLTETLAERYAGFLTATPSSAPFEFTLGVTPGEFSNRCKPRVSCADGRWRVERRDCYAEWSSAENRGWLVQSSGRQYPVGIVLRILYSALLVPRGGFLLHAAGAIRDGKAFVFSGVSGAGKSTLSRLAPPDVSLLTDETSYLGPSQNGYLASSTPFSGRLPRDGNLSAPLKAVYLLAQGPENKSEPLPNRLAASSLLRNILFFSQDPESKRLVFEAACRLVAHVPVYRLTFAPTPRVWDLIV
jgi:hypothetical protein